MQRAGKRYADERPVVILLRGINLLTVVLAEVLLSKGLIHVVEDGALLSTLRAHKTDDEVLVDSETEDALNEGTDDLEMHDCDHDVLEQVCAQLVDSLALVFKLLL